MRVPPAQAELIRQVAAAQGEPVTGSVLRAATSAADRQHRADLRLARCAGMTLVPLLLCDLDGTLVDRAGAFRRWATDLAARHGQDGDFVDWVVEVDDDGGITREALYEASRTRIPLVESSQEFRAGYGEHYPGFFEPEPAVAVALERARAAGWATAVVTNGGAHQADKIAAARLGHLLDVVCISALEDAWKPDPRLLEIAAGRAGVGLGETWMIGDNADADIGAAVAAGVPSVWLRRGRAWPRTDYLPQAQADSFGEAVHLVLETAGP